MLLKKEVLRWSMDIQAEGCQKAFDRLFHRKCTFNGDEHFRAPKARTDAYAAGLAQKRGFPATRRDGRPWHHRVMLSPGTARRLKNYEKLAQARGFYKKSSLLVNLSQNPGYADLHATIPTLLRRSQLWSMKRSRMMIPEEACEVMGMRLFNSADDGFESPMKQAILAGKLNDRELRSMSGNAMHLSAIGSCLVFVLSATHRM